MSNMLEFDPIATNPDNWFVNERHTISPANGNSWRFFKPKYGPFFTDDLEVRHQGTDGTWERLAPGTHYTLGFVYLDMKRHILQPVYTVVQIIDENLSGEFEIDYHSLGGDGTDIVHALVIEGAAALLEPKRYTLEDIADMPEFLPPVDHNVLTDNIFGWNKVVNAVWALTYAIAGDPTIEHSHDISQINGLLDLLDGKASLDNSHKVGMHNAQRFVNATNSTISLTIPKTVVPVTIRMQVAIITPTGVAIADIEGRVHREADITNTNQNWIFGECRVSGNVPFDRVSFTYDSGKRPVVYFGAASNFTDHTFVLMDITWGSDATADKRSGYTFTKETTPRGSLKAIRTGFTLDTVSSGILYPNTVWHAPSSDIARRLASESDAPLKHGDTIDIIHVAKGGVNPRLWPPGVSGNIKGYESDTLRLSRLGSTLNFKYDGGSKKWVLISGS